MTAETRATREDLARMAADYLADPAGWPAAMASRAVRLAAGHPPYSASNQVLIVCQLWERFARAGMSDDDAFTAAMSAAAEETAPAGVWRKRGFTPARGGMWIWSRPFTVFRDADGNRAYSADKLEGNVSSYRSFTVERTYLARDVFDLEGNDGTSAFTAPELPDGYARDVFDRLSAWITGQGWTVTRSGRDSAASGSTRHAARAIMVHGGLVEWPAVETLAHEIAHALLHGDDDSRPYVGEHRGDMEAEAESVAFGVLTAFGEHELARGSVRYAAEWTRDADRVAAAFESACHVTDALVSVAMGETDVTVRESARAAKLAAKTSNRELAARLRDAGIEPTGEAWRLAKSGAPMSDILTAVTS